MNLILPKVWHVLSKTKVSAPKHYFYSQTALLTKKGTRSAYSSIQLVQAKLQKKFAVFTSNRSRTLVTFLHKQAK